MTEQCSFLGCLLLLATLTACSPALNWRDTPLPESSVTALLPCEADHARRSVPLGGVATELTMAGCEAGGATFAVMLAEAPASQASSLLEGWRSATLANMKAKDVQTQAFSPKGSLALRESVRIAGSGQRADGQSVRAQAVWFARIAPGGRNAQLVHLVMYSERPMLEAADTFFSGLKLQ
ncbi:hypothetical protein [Ottowia thiooxydans]|uniref:Lipoprotein n=1 Tax=Ottowia thiooxydans TaxID=219182 RepID=A0ABV2QAP1_9BURK